MLPSMVYRSWRVFAGAPRTKLALLWPLDALRMDGRHLGGGTVQEADMCRGQVGLTYESVGQEIRWCVNRNKVDLWVATLNPSQQVKEPFCYG